MKTRHDIEVLKAGWLRLVRWLEDVHGRHDAALAHLIEGRSDAAYRVLSGYAE